MAATIKDIARILKISTSTVSYALNGGPRTVPEEVKNKVLELAKELDYRPNRVARSLVTGRTNSVGVVPPAVGADVFLSPFVRAAWNGLVSAAAPLDQDLLLYTGHDRNRPEDQGFELMDGRIDGVVFIAPRPDAGSLRAVAQRGLPLATVSGERAEGGISYTCDNRGGVREAVRHLVTLGHRRIAHITGNLAAGDGVVRHEAFLAALSEFGVEPDHDLIVHGNFTIVTGAECGNYLLDLPKPPTAVFCSNDEMAYGMCQVARERGVSVPEQLSVVGFDDTVMNAIVTPPLTTVRQPINDMAIASLRAVVRLIQGGDPPQAHEFPTELIVRGSTAEPFGR